VLKGRYPENALKLYKKKGIELSFPEDDLKLISQPIDFIAFNNYSSEFIKYDPSSESGFSPANSILEKFEKTDMAGSYILKACMICLCSLTGLWKAKHCYQRKRSRLQR